jgi:hypothetical protein
MFKKCFITIILLSIFTAFVLCLPNPKWTSSITISPENPAPGDVVTFDALFVIQNEDAGGLVIAGGIDGAELHRQSYGPLAQRHRESFRFTWTAVAGSHTVYMQIDPESAYPDASRTDNRAELSFRVLLESPVQDSSELDDLTPAGNSGGSSITPLNSNDRRLLTTDDCARHKGETPDVTVDFFSLQRVSLRVEDPIEYRYSLRIKNLSPVCIYRLKYRILDQGGATIREVTLIPTKYKWVLKGNETTTFSNIFGMRDISNFGFCRMMSGEYICTRIKAVLDPDNALTETNESNNESVELTAYFGLR